MIFKTIVHVLVLHYRYKTVNKQLGMIITVVYNNVRKIISAGQQYEMRQASILTWKCEPTSEIVRSHILDHDRLL
jgi:hypothetical protein